MDAKKAIVLMCIVQVQSGALAVGFVGPPVAGLQQGEWRLGYSFTHADMDLERTSLRGYGIEVDDGVIVVGPNPWVDKMKVEDFKIQRHYITLGYGLSEIWEIYGLLGGADLKAAYYKEGEWDSLNFDTDFAWGWGTRMTLFQHDNIKWGVAAQMNWLDTRSTETEATSEYISTITVDIESYDLLITLGPTVDMGRWRLYGGPLFYYLNGDFDRVHTSAFGTYVYKGVGSADLEADSNIGGFLGGQVDVRESLDLTAEFSFTGDGWAAGIGLDWYF